MDERRGDEETLDGIVREALHPLADADDLNPLMERIGDARLVLLGEASHGTSEYYTWRACISDRLLREKDFSFIAVEGDWPDCFAINRYVKDQQGAGENAEDTLRAFERWPTWMWANREVEDFTEWLHAFNRGRPPDRKVGFYGLDVYSLWESMGAVVDYLEDVDPEAADAARQAYKCFEPYGEDMREYARATLVPEDCEDEVVDALVALRERAPAPDGDGPEAAFAADQNALVARNAERYYRAMVRGGGGSWNVRDRHMMETLDRLLEFHGDDAKGIVWAHNTHVGDARHTDMADAGLVNLGQLAREAHGRDDTALVGFGTHRGRVVAGRGWGAPMDRMRVPAAREGSWEDVLHGSVGTDGILLSNELAGEDAAMAPRPHRAIGVVYEPGRERYGNYVPTVLPERYDAFLYVDETDAVSPLDVPPHWDEEPPETYPYGV